MAFRELRVFEVREVLRLWLAGEGFRSVERLSQVDRKTVRRYVTAAEQLGVQHDDGDDQLTDVFIAMAVEAVRPHRCDGHSAPWRLLTVRHEQIVDWVTDGLTGVKIHELLDGQGVKVPLRTVQRYLLEVCGRSRGRGPTVRIADGEPGDEALCGVPHSRWTHSRGQPRQVGERDLRAIAVLATARLRLRRSARRSRSACSQVSAPRR